MIVDWSGSLERQNKRLKEMLADSDARIDELLTMVRVTEAERDEALSENKRVSRIARRANQAAKHYREYIIPQLHAKIKDLGRKVWREKQYTRLLHDIGTNMFIKGTIHATASAAWKRIAKHRRSCSIWNYDQAEKARDIARRMMHERDAAQKKNEDWLGLYCEIDPREIKAQLSEARAERDELRPAANKWARYGHGYDTFIRKIDELEADNADLKASINLYADQVDRQAKEVQVYHRDNAKLSRQLLGYDHTAAERDKLRAKLNLRSASQHVALTDNAKLRAALKQVEWVRVYLCAENTHWKECAYCHHGETVGHAPDCPRQLALGLAGISREQDKILCNTDGDRCKDTGNMLHECECDNHAPWHSCGGRMHLVRPGKWQCKVCE